MKGSLFWRLGGQDLYRTCMASIMNGKSSEELIDYVDGSGRSLGSSDGGGVQIE